MNTHAEYRRHGHRPPEQAAVPDGNEAAINQLAHHHDPSLASSRGTPTTKKKGIAWVRPTDLATYAAPIVGRGIDLQAELVRRARRAPATATRRLHRPASSAPAMPAPIQEGLGL
jgi:hypothetical protein